LGYNSICNDGVEPLFYDEGDLPMSISVELTQDELAQLQQITKLPIPADAVSQAAREFLRLSELKAVSGKVDFENNWKHGS
jgi:hypothetical protein